VFIGHLALGLAAKRVSPRASPPPSVNALVVTAIIGAAVTIVLTWWVDRHRESTCLMR